MKNTKYFKTVQDVNNYYPDGVPSNVIAIVGDGSNVFISSDNAGSGNQQYYSADMTNDEIVAEQVQAAEQQGYDTGYTAGETAGYDTGYAAGQAAGGTNWLDVLYLDEKAKTEAFLGVSGWDTSDFVKYNFAKYATSEPYIDQHSALAFILGLQNNNTMFKLIKITKDADGNAIITNNSCSINFDGQNVGAIALDGVTYYNKICVWGTVTLAAGDEVIMSCATKFEDVGTGDLYSLGLFGGFDDETNDPATYKCETAGTYTFGLWVDVPQVQDGQAACFVSSMFNYEGSATVPAITVPTGETSGGSGTLTDVQIEQMSMGMFMTGNDSVISNSCTFVINTSGMDSEYIKARITAEMGLYIDKYNTTDGLVDISTSLDVTITYHEDGDDGYISAIIPLVTGDKVGFGFYSIETDPETGDIVISSIPSQYLKNVYWIDGNNNSGYKHFHDIATTGNYEARWQLSTDPESGDVVVEFSFTEVVQP